MAVLSEAERLKIFSHYCRNILAPPSCVKADIKAAVAAADDWVESNQVSYASSLPNPFKSASDATQKTLLLMCVLMRRMGKLWVEGD